MVNIWRRVTSQILAGRRGDAEAEDGPTACAFMLDRRDQDFVYTNGAIGGPGARGLADRPLAFPRRPAYNYGSILRRRQ